VSANALDLLDLENGVIPWAWTRWQRDRFPFEYRGDFFVQHPGVDPRWAEAFPSKPRTIAGRPIPAGARVVSFVASRLDRLRGFDRFVRLAARILRADPDVVCVAAAGSSLGRALDIWDPIQGYADTVLSAAGLTDPSRFWLSGEVSPAVVRELLRASDLHVYPARPYPVARSLLEALACRCVALAADNEPVPEVIE
jgi:glycosyltransferase involved in cell wall biosynthesis